jgi:hypothetical protein
VAHLVIDTLEEKIHLIIPGFTLEVHFLLAHLRGLR